MNRYRVTFWIANVPEPIVREVEAEDETEAVLDATMGHHAHYVDHQTELLTGRDFLPDGPMFNV